MNQAAVPSWLQRTTVWLALVGALVSVAVFGQRGCSVWRVAHVAPGSAVTSGFEEESLLAVWHAVHGQPVYADATRLPYSSAYFNWLFYAAYAGAIGPVVSAYGDAAIPLAGRLLTGAGALAGAGCLFWLLRRALNGSSALAAGISTFVFFGPLVGWWAFTVRPDVWALTIETSALTVLLTGYRRRPRTAALVSALLFYAAWAFKQTYVTGLGAAVMFLFIRRQWRPALLLTVTSIGLWAATFALMDPAYRSSFVDGGSAGVYLLSAGIQNFADLLKKSFPLWLLATATLWPREERSIIPGLGTDLSLVGWLGLLGGLPLAFAGTCKVGASSNYYFSVLLMLAFLAAGIGRTGRIRSMVFTAFGGVLLLQLLILSGHLGQIDLRPQAREHAEIWSVWRRQPEPRFAATTAFNVPWLSPDSPPLVLAFNYWRHRETEHKFEADGVGGLIRTGYFRSLLLPAETGSEYDGGRLNLYTRGETVHNLTVFRRQDQPLPPEPAYGTRP